MRPLRSGSEDSRRKASRLGEPYSGATNGKVAFLSPANNLTPDFSVNFFRERQTSRQDNHHKPTDDLIFGFFPANQSVDEKKVQRRTGYVREIYLQMMSGRAMLSCGGGFLSHKNTGAESCLLTHKRRLVFVNPVILFFIFCLDPS